MQNAKPIRWFTFIVLVIGGGTVFKLSSLKDAFYVPMQEFMNLSNTQIGLALSVYGDSSDCRKFRFYLYSR